MGNLTSNECSPKLANDTDLFDALLFGLFRCQKPSLAALEFRSATFYFALLMLCCCTIGSIGNMTSIWVFTRPSMRSSPINVLLAALSTVDLAVIITAVAVFIVPSLNTFLYDVDPGLLYKILICGFYQAGMMAQTCSIWTFVLISLERYIAVCCPLQARQRLTVNRARNAFLLILILSFLYNIPRFFEWKLDEKRGYVSFLREDKYYFAIYFTSMFLITHFLVPFLIISILNLIIFKAMRRARLERTKLANVKYAKTARKHQTTRMITLVTLVFALCNTLPFVLNIWEAVDRDLFARRQTKLAAYLTLDVSNTLVVTNSSTTFIFYFVYCQKYRSLLMNKVLAWCRPGHKQNGEGKNEDPGTRCTLLMKRDARMSIAEPRGLHIMD